MKKILLATTTLIGAAGLFAGAALADSPKVTLGGFADFQVGITGEDNDAGERSSAFRSDTEISIKIDGKTDGGLGYGGEVDLEADVDGDGSDPTTGVDSDNQGLNASRTFVYLEGAWGRVQMGSDLGVTNTMKVDASRIARATGGIDGDFTYFVTPTTGQVIATPDLIMDYGLQGAGANPQLGDESTENNNKVSYYTPRFSGFQAGVSYIISDLGRGQAISRADTTAGRADNIFAGALSWEGKFDQVGIALAATGEWGHGQTAATEDLRTWEAGAKFSYMGFSIAGSYGDWGDSLRTASNLNDNWFWDVGAAYENGPFGVSVTYLRSNYEASATTDNKFDNVSVGVDYKLAPGFTPYAEVSFISVDPTGTAQDNDATVGIVGTVLNF